MQPPCWKTRHWQTSSGSIPLIRSPSLVTAVLSKCCKKEGEGAREYEKEIERERENEKGKKTKELINKRAYKHGNPPSITLKQPAIAWNSKRMGRGEEDGNGGGGQPEQGGTRGKAEKRKSERSKSERSKGERSKNKSENERARE